jgi:serine/threonine protein phosphatase PrpC
LAVQVQDRLRTNPFVCRASLNQATEHEVYAYSVFGLNKKEPANEDRVVCWNRGPISFVLVADGVSTVDLGSGEQAAEEIVRLFRARFQPRLEKLASPAALAEGARQFLRDFFVEANVQVVAHVNRLFDPASGVVPEAPLCSTLTAVVVVHDQAWISFVGDSPALLYSRATGRLLQLSIEDHVALLEEYDPDSGIDPRALTQVIGQCRFVEESRRFEPEELNIPVVQVQLHPGDLLVIGSDGLLECIDEPTARARLQRAEAELRRLHGVDHPLRLIVRELILLGEEGLSDDNISAAAVRIVGAEILDDEPHR